MFFMESGRARYYDIPGVGIFCVFDYPNVNGFFPYHIRIYIFEIINIEHRRRSGEGKEIKKATGTAERDRSKSKDVNLP